MKKCLFNVELLLPVTLSANSADKVEGKSLSALESEYSIVLEGGSKKIKCGW